MRRITLFSGVLAAVLILMLPAASALQLITTTQKHPSLLTAHDIDLGSIQEKYSKNPTPQTLILLTLAIIFLKLLRMSILLPIFVVIIYLRLISL